MITALSSVTIFPTIFGNEKMLPLYETAEFKVGVFMKHNNHNYNKFRDVIVRICLCARPKTGFYIEKCNGPN